MPKAFRHKLMVDMLLIWKKGFLFKILEKITELMSNMGTENKIVGQMAVAKVSDIPKDT